MPLPDPIASEPHSRVRRRPWVPLLALSLALTLPGTWAGDWPSLRGPHSDGSARGGGALGETMALQLAWQRAIGEGYSGVTVAGGRAVSAFSDGTSDVIVAWSAADGHELWRTPIGPTYRGHDGSTDGPVGTATLTDKRAFLVGPRGDLLALSLDTGKILWKKSLTTEWGARAPTYGFGINPIEVDGVLVVAVGAEERSVVGLDPADGRLLWSLGSDRVEYSTPVVIPADGGPQVVVAGARDLVGIDPAQGTLVWTHRHSETAGYDPTYPQLQPVGERLLLTFEGEAVLYAPSRTAAGVRLSEVWRTNALKDSVAIPVAWGGHLYGYNGTFLTCVDLKDGAVVWKSRHPRGRGLILVDDQLVVLGSGGTLTVGRADPAGFRETASLSVSDHGGYTAPSFADGRIYLRNRSRIAAVAIRDGEHGRPREVESTTEVVGGVLADWVRRIEGSDEPAKSAREFLATQTAFPVVEDDWVHFVYAGPGRAVSVVGQMNDGVTGDPLRRIGDTDVFVRSYPAVRGGRWQYRFQVDFGDAQVDARNPLRVAGGSEMSEVLLPGFADPPFVTEPATARGRLETLHVQSAAYAEGLDVQVYLPAGFDPAQRYPLIVLPNGPQWIEDGGIVGILDHLFEKRRHRALVALVPISGWVGGSWGSRALTLLGEELLPAIEARYRISEDIAQRTLWTVEDKAAVALTLALRTPGPFGRFAMQSPKLYFQEPPALGTLSDPSRAFFVSWSRYEFQSIETGTDDRAEATRLFEGLRGTGLPTAGGEFAAGPGYRTWRTEADAILTFLLGPAAPG